MIDISGVRVSFNKGTPLEAPAIRQLDLVVPRSQFLTIIGTNGAGKSTALNVIAGLVRPYSGKVMVDGQNVTNWPIHQRSRLISRVFQDSPKMGALRGSHDPRELCAGPWPHSAARLSLRHR